MKRTTSRPGWPVSILFAIVRPATNTRNRVTPGARFWNGPVENVKLVETAVLIVLQIGVCDLELEPLVWRRRLDVPNAVFFVIVHLTAIVRRFTWVGQTATIV